MGENLQSMIVKDMKSAKGCEKLIRLYSGNSAPAAGNLYSIADFIRKESRSMHLNLLVIPLLLEFQRFFLECFIREKPLQEDAGI